MLQGVAQFVASGARWEVRLVAGIKGHVERINEWRPDGVLAVIDRSERIEDWLALRCPVVSVASEQAAGRIHCVTMDEHAIGRVAAEHLIDCRFRHFGYVGYRDNPASQGRLAGFAEGVVGVGSFSCLNPEHAAMVLPVGQVQPFDKSLLDWLSGLDLPVGVMAWNDVTATVVVQACARLGLSVPEQVAVIGVDNDETWCELCVPPLSSVRPPSHLIGYEAASLLQRCIDGEASEAVVQRYPPEGVEVRRSTDIVAISDPLVAQALSFIRSKLGEPISVADVVDHVPASRRVIEDRFRKHLGRSPKEEIQREQLSLADHLLRSTDLPLKIVASRSGFRDANHLSRVYGRERGMPPAAYRKTYRLT
jgi:LacI family transcriptional regulator